MDQLIVRFTIKGDVGETLFGLYTDKSGQTFLRGTSETGKLCLFKLYQDDNKLFHLEEDPSSLFKETPNIIENRLIGLSETWMDVVSQGIEEDTTSEKYESEPGYGPDDIYVENKAFSISQIMDLIKDGDIELSPFFQRHFVWDTTRQSQLIESILLGLPLPTIYLSQYPDGRLTIVDGLQRINTIKRFLEDQLILCNMEYLEYCNGKTFSQLKDVLPLIQWRRFKQTQILCFVIDYRSPSNLKYDLFRRLNTGGKPLNPQEIRNCLSRPHLQEILSSMANSPEFLQTTNYSVKDTRMEAQELALRFIFFYDQYTENNSIGNYSGNLDATLNAYVDKLNNYSANALNQYKELYSKSMIYSHKLFGEYAFRKVMRNYQTAHRKPQVNKQLLVVTSVILAKYSDLYSNKINNLTGTLTPYLASMIDNDNNSQLFNAISWSTNSKSNIKYTFDYLKHNLFDKYLLNNEESQN